MDLVRVVFDAALHKQDDATAERERHRLEARRALQSAVQGELAVLIPDGETVKPDAITDLKALAIRKAGEQGIEPGYVERAFNAHWVTHERTAELMGQYEVLQDLDSLTRIFHERITSILTNPSIPLDIAKRDFVVEADYEGVKVYENKSFETGTTTVRHRELLVSYDFEHRGSHAVVETSSKDKELEELISALTEDLRNNLSVKSSDKKPIYSDEEVANLFRYRVWEDIARRHPSSGISTKATLIPEGRGYWFVQNLSRRNFVDESSYYRGRIDFYQEAGTTLRLPWIGQRRKIGTITFYSDTVTGPNTPFGMEPTYYGKIHGFTVDVYDPAFLQAMEVLNDVNRSTGELRNRNIKHYT